MSDDASGSGSGSGSYTYTSSSASASGSYESETASGSSTIDMGETNGHVEGGIDARPPPPSAERKPAKASVGKEKPRKPPTAKAKPKKAPAKPKCTPFVVGDRIDGATGAVRYEFVRNSAVEKPLTTVTDEDLRAYMSDPACRAFAIQALLLHVNGKAASTVMRQAHVKREGRFFTPEQIDTVVEDNLRDPRERAQAIQRYLAYAREQCADVGGNVNSTFRKRLIEEEAHVMLQDIMLTELPTSDLLPHSFSGAIDNGLADVPLHVMLFTKNDDKEQREFTYDLLPQGFIYKMNRRYLLAATVRECVAGVNRPSHLGDQQHRRPTRLRSLVCSWAFGNFLAKRLEKAEFGDSAKEMLAALTYDKQWKLPCNADTVAALVNATFDCNATAAEFQLIENQAFADVHKAKAEKAAKAALAKERKAAMQSPKSRKDSSESESKKHKKKKHKSEHNNASPKKEADAPKKKRRRKEPKSEDAAVAKEEKPVGDGDVEVVGPAPPQKRNEGPPRSLHLSTIDENEVPGQYEDSAYHVRVASEYAQQRKEFESKISLRTVPEVNAAFANATLESNTTSAQKRTKNGTKGVTTSRCALDVQSGRMPKVARSVLTETVEVHANGTVDSAVEPLQTVGENLGAVPVGANQRNVRISVLSAYNESVSDPAQMLTSAELHDIAKQMADKDAAISADSAARVFLASAFLTTHIDYIVRRLARRGDIIDVANSESKDIETFARFVGDDKKFQAYYARCLLHADNVERVVEALMSEGAEAPKLHTVPAVDAAEGNGFDLMQVWARS